MYDHQVQEHFFYMMLYGAVAMMSLLASCYLLFRRSNAIAPEVTSPVRLRRWTAAFFASMTLSHIWYLPILFLTSDEDILRSYLAGAVLDFMTLIPLALVMLLVMLQDRRRPLWPVGVMVAPVIIGLSICFLRSNIDFLPLFHAYHVLLGICLTIYMIRATRQYGRWLRENYADLEHKEVWQSLTVLAIILLVFGIYSYGFKSMTYKYITQLNNIVLISYLLWRVEPLSDLSIPAIETQDAPVAAAEAEGDDQPPTFLNDIGPLLKQFCEEPRLYLQYDVSVAQLATLLGTNRVYLSKYFARQGTTYNAYINSLRLQHVIKLYHEAVAAGQPVIAKQLAYRSGFRSYSTFSAVFKQIMGMTVTEWMHSMEE